ncbi:class A beta-lactamase [Bailinhaonella thermotolerans]|uniref:Beta-lactamase n=1 Tax=Bailinhaonella thermotolerans TaxID=1070861 RepID=A0A3A4AYS6_9ACTN|nr:class A beta-lactamase [Bailinhaonella thermotolerans]RJL34273.1 class A beta-lactamase [Bailinhaonella thermotolerans]
MPADRSWPSRRALLLAAALLPAAGCTAAGGPAAQGSPPAPRRTPPGTAPPAPSPSPTPGPSATPDPARYRALERRHGARLGVYALNTATGAVVAHRAGERFAFCSTFKTLAAAAVLDRYSAGGLRKRIRIAADDIDSISPVTRNHVGAGLTLRELCEAAVRHSDGTAADLLVRDLGGPARFNAYLRGLGDTVTRLDHYEPELNAMRPGDPRDTTTPEAIAGAYRRLILGDALPEAERALLTGWLKRNATPVGRLRVRAGVPRGWTVADKTGTGRYGRANDVAVVWPPGAPPLVIAVMTDRPAPAAEPRDALIAQATRRVVADLT